MVDIRELFPFPELRPAQVQAFNAWDKVVEKNKRFAVFELPTGTGKSPLSYTVGDWAKRKQDHDDGGDYQSGGYILTTQKTLQDQYMRDFEKLGLVQVQGRANYPCATHNTDCSAGAAVDKVNEILLKTSARDLAAGKITQSAFDADVANHPTGCPCCPYVAARETFIGKQTPETRLGVTNFAYFLTAVKTYQLFPRDVLIIDEAHNTETQILGQIEIEITRKRCEELGCEPPPMINVGDVAQARAWLLDVFVPSLINMQIMMRVTIQSTEDKREQIVLIRKLEQLTQLESRVALLSREEGFSEWFGCSEEKTGALKLRPLTARYFAEEMLFRMGKRILFLSATILDGQAFIKGLGLDGGDGGFLRVDSDFPVENRPIHYIPAGSMSYKNIDKTLPLMVRYVERALDKHQFEKGIVHCQSYKLRDAILAHLSGTKHASRLLAHQAGGTARKDALLQHVTSEEPTVLLSPSMTEGLDLAEDLSRFQVMAKVPYPFLGDPFVKARMAYDPKWYTWQTALSTMQATGRSVRSREDTATTYLFDADFGAFLSKAESILPAWWKRAVVYR